VSAVSFTLNVAIIALAGVSALPQTLRLLRTRATAGLSGTAVTLAVVFDIAWIAYTLGRGRLGPATADIVYLASALLLAGAATRAGLIRRPSLRVGALAGAALAAVAIGGHVAGSGWVPLGLVLAAQQLVVATPTILTVWRADSLDGIAPATYALTILSAAFGGAYAVLVGDGPLLLWAVLATATSIPVLARYRWVQARALQPATSPAR
jgi:hypothetical protein